MKDSWVVQFYLKYYFAQRVKQEAKKTFELPVPIRRGVIHYDPIIQLSYYPMIY